MTDPSRTPPPDDKLPRDEGRRPAFDPDATQVLTGQQVPPDFDNAATLILTPEEMRRMRDEPATMKIDAPAPPAATESSAQTDPTDPAATVVLPAAAVAAAMAAAASVAAPAGAQVSSGTLPGKVPTPAGTLPGKREAEGSEVRRVGRYQILERLGRGGMATVFKAHDPGIGRDVAIKFLHASLCEDEGCRMRFLREAGAAGRLQHPNIAVVHDVGEIDGRPYMAMELLTGESLADELEKHKTLPLREVISVGIELARALDFAHAKGIVHRDIKPGNILRLRDSRTIKVTDFGIAHIDNPADDATDRTRVGDILGTPQYMSPEQARGDRIDGRSDLFSAGIVLYQMITGQRPFRGDNLVAVATKIANEDPPPIDKVRQGVPASLRRVVDRCLAKQPEKRFQSGAELSEALIKVLAEVDEANASKNRSRIVPLRVKWAATMALIVAVVMGLTATVITQRQVAAMMNQASDYGASLARFIAAQNAAAVLGEDWETVEVSVQEIMKTRNFERVVVMDLNGTVRVSSAPGQAVGKPYAPLAAESLAKLGGNTQAMRYQVDGESVLGFEAPITFHDKLVGKVALGIAEKPLTQVARLSITLMIILAVVTVLAVAIAMYFVADWFAKPVRLLSESMREIAKGRFDHRIAEKRKDEFGQLYEVFDAMAAALQQRQASGADAEMPTGMGGDTAKPATLASRPATVANQPATVLMPGRTGGTGGTVSAPPSAPSSSPPPAPPAASANAEEATRIEPRPPSA